MSKLKVEKQNRSHPVGQTRARIIAATFSIAILTYVCAYGRFLEDDNFIADSHRIEWRRMAHSKIESYCTKAVKTSDASICTRLATCERNANYYNRIKCCVRCAHDGILVVISKNYYYALNGDGEQQHLPKNMQRRVRWKNVCVCVHCAP